jgi:hypothetical protein
VTVTTDGVSLFVRYQTDGDWVFSETHVYLGLAEPEKSAPGQFPFGEENLPFVTQWTWESTLADLGFDLGDTIYVAAHAVAWEVALETQIVSDTDVQVIRFNGEPVDPSADAVLAWTHSSWATWITDPYFSDSTAEWIWKTYYVTYPEAGEVVWFQREFTLPTLAGDDGSGGSFDFPAGVTLRIAADNGYLAFLNGRYAAHHGIVLTDEHGGWEICHDECHVPSWCWTCAVTTWEIGDLLVSGTNTFTVGAVEEQMGGGTVESNPAGLIFEMTIRVPGDQDETAWAAGTTGWKQGWGSYTSFLLDDAP